MVVPTYLGTMTLGGMGGMGAMGGMTGLGGMQLNGASLQQYNNLLMSNMTHMNPALQLSGLSDQSSYPGSNPSNGQPVSCYSGFQVTSSQLPLLSTSAPNNGQLTTPNSQPGESQTQKSETCPNIYPAKSFSPGATSPTPGDQQSPTPSNMLEEVNVQYLKELQTEKESLESSATEEILKGHALKLLENEIVHIQSGGSKSYGYREHIKYFDIYRERPIRLTVRALIPVREHPKFNFVGKLLGPKGNSMKRLQEETMTKMAVLGRGSMRDKQKEEELRSSADPKYQHLQEDLHVEITAFAPPAEAHARIAYALTEVRKYLIPDSNDEIRQEQMREMEMISTNGDVIDNLKQTSAIVLNGSLAGLRSQALSFPVTTPQTTLNLNGGANPVLQGLQTVGSSNGFITAPFLAAGANVNIESSTHSSETRETPVSRPDQFTNSSTTLDPTSNWQGLKSPSSYDTSKHRMSSTPYTKPV